MNPHIIVRWSIDAQIEVANLSPSLERTIRTA